MNKNPMNLEWVCGGMTRDEGYKIVTKNFIIGNECDGHQRQLIAVVYDESIADYICSLHNCSLSHKGV